MKRLLLLINLLCCTLCYSQNTVQVIGNGIDESRDKAINAALRSCIEKTFGVFISSKTEISNDEFLKDEISTIASGNIISYDVVSEVKQGNKFNLIVSAIVSPENIVKVMRSKNYEFEIAGSVYAQNILKEEFYRKQEFDILSNFINTWKNIQLFDFDIITSEPQVISEVLFKCSDKFNSKLNEYNKMIEAYYDNKKIIGNKFIRGGDIGSDPKQSYFLKARFPQYEFDLTSSACTLYNGKDESGFLSGYKHNDYNYKANEYNLLESYHKKTINYSLQVLFLPKPSIAYEKFVESLVNLLEAISIKDIVEYKKLNAEFVEVQVNYISNFVVKYSKLKKENFNCYIRNIKSSHYLKTELKNLILLKSTALNFEEQNLNGLTSATFMFMRGGLFPYYMIETGRISTGGGTSKENDDLIIYNPYFYITNDAYTWGTYIIPFFQPSILVIPLTLGELNSLKTIKFVSKQ